MRIAVQFLACLYMFCVPLTAWTQSRIDWFGFNINFISATYPPGSAFGKITARRFHSASEPHHSSCGRHDAERHIGIPMADIQLPGNQMPLSYPVGPETPWGIVAEIPNANSASQSQLAKLNNELVTFWGYFRVWSEGHAKGPYADSNPHHIFEVHPACCFTEVTGKFIQPNRVAPIANYNGYGIEKLGRLLKSISAWTWPRVYQTGTRLYVGFAQEENFYQIPAQIKIKRVVTSGHEWLIDVFSDKNHNKLLYSGLIGGHS